MAAGDRTRTTLRWAYGFSRLAVAALLALLVALDAGCTNSIRGPGVVAPDAPAQTTLERPSYQPHGDFLLERIAEFEVVAAVLSAKRYRLGREARLAPVDLALGWGPMSDQAIVDRLSISQFRRFYWWKARQLPIPRRDIERHSANMHMIPATPEVARHLKRVRRGDVVHLSGYLVNASMDGRWRWRTSVTRDDTGSGACELVLVEEVRVADGPHVEVMLQYGAYRFPEKSGRAGQSVREGPS